MPTIKFNITPLKGDPLKLPADFKAKWLEALRGGNYKQTDGYLHTDEGFCCLGVACDVSGAGWSQHGVRRMGVDLYMTQNHASATMPAPQDLPAEVYAALHQPTDAYEQYPDEDFDSDLIDVGDGESAPSVMAALAGMNDTNHTFAEIADWIEANL